jgi:uncharacterized membrane protein
MTQKSTDTWPGDGDSRETSREEQRGGNGDEGAATTIGHELKEAIRDAALEVLGPAARQATTSAARYAVTKGPELVKENVMPAVTKAGGPGNLGQQAVAKGAEALSRSGGVGGIVGKLMSKLGRGGGGGEASGWGRNRRMPVQQDMYVSVPLSHAYNGWTDYKQWPRYMHRANQVDSDVTDEQVRVRVTEKMWGLKRPFTAEVVSQRPDEHIRWNATAGTKHTGVINFHALGPRLTLIEVNVDHAPSGPTEKIARGGRFVKRAVRADLHRFRGWIEMKSEDELTQLEGWRGTIEDGQIVKTHEDAVAEEHREENQQPEGEYPRDALEPDGAEIEQPQAQYKEAAPEDEDEDQEPEGGYEEAAPEEAEEEARMPRRRQPRGRTTRPADAEDEPESTPSRAQPRRRTRSQGTTQTSQATATGPRRRSQPARGRQ